MNDDLKNNYKVSIIKMETFDFEKTNSKFSCNISPNIILHIMRINHSVALLYFTDEMCNNINVPEDIVVYACNHQDINIKIIENPIKQCYSLCWTDNYTIEYKKIEILSLNSQRKWNIIS